MSIKLHRNPPFRAEHLGSLLRTDKLLEGRHANEAGKASDSELRTVEDSDVKDIVKTQLGLGYHAITDGETAGTVRGIPVVKGTVVLQGLTLGSVLGILLARTRGA